MKQCIELEKLPISVSAHFSQNGVVLDDALLVMRSDMCRDGVYGDCFILLFKDKIIISEGSIVITREGRRLHGEPVRSETFDERNYYEYSVFELGEPQVEQLISTGRVVAEKDDEQTLLFCFSSTYKHDAGIFCRVVSEWQKEKKIDFKAYEKENSESRRCPKCGKRYPDPERKVCPRCMDKAKLTKRLFSLFMSYKGYIFLIFLTIALSAGLGVLTPQISKRVLYDDVLSPNGAMHGQLITVIFMIIGVRLLTLVMNLLSGIVNAKVAADVTCGLKKKIFGALGRLSLDFFTNRQTGGLMTQVNSDSSTIYWFFCDGFPYAVMNVIQLVAIAAVMAVTDPMLTLYSFVTVPVFFIAFKLIFNMFQKLHAKAYSKRRSFNSLISDVLNGMRVVKAFSREDTEKKRFASRSEAVADIETELSVTSGKIFPFLFFLLKIGSYIVWAIGGWQVMARNGSMTYGTLALFVSYATMIYSPIEMLADVSNWWGDCLNALQRLFEISDAQPSVRESEKPITADIKGAVEFKNVSFSYVENRKVISDVSFDVAAGSVLGIVGQTGAGKSTLANLLTRLYDPSDGEVLIDGNNIKDYSFETLRKSIAIVSQETYLFAGSILENIRYACPEATLEQVMTAARIAHAHDFIIKYPDGYNTKIGIGFKELSGGEKQRVSIARALLTNPKILILDEATAAMDTQTERSIQQALTKLSKERTTIIIAHRLSTLRDADKLIAIEDGKLAESGTADELLRKKGVYHKLYKMQAEALKTIGIQVD